MKNSTKLIVFILFSLFFSLYSKAQIYNGTTYQAVIRNASNALVVNTVVGVKISVLQSSSAGTVVFSERQTPTTNANGLATFVIGEGIALVNSYFAINWLNGPYFIKTETDPTGGTNYTISGTSQMNTVPYALWTENSYYAENSGDSWKRTGNIVDASTEFIGATNNVDVIFKRNNIKAGLLGINNNTSFGEKSLLNVSTAQNNTAIGAGALEANQSGFSNTAIGTNALRSNTGQLNTAVGAASLFSNTSGILNTSVGNSSLKNNIVGEGNVSIGNNSLENSIGFYNTALGYQSLKISTGDQNTAIGWRSLDLLTTGGGNIGIGRIANVPVPTTNNQLSIGNVIYGTNMGDTALGTVGIGVAVPTEKLEVSGKTKTTNLQVTNGAGMSRVLTSDAAGNASWQLPSNVNTGIHVSKSISQTIVPDTDVKIDFNNEVTDDANAFDTTTSEWTIPSDGFYHINASARFIPFPANQNVEIVIYVNGVLRKFSNKSISGISNFEISTDIKLFLNDKVSISVYQTTGANATLAGSPSAVYFSGYKIY